MALVVSSGAEDPSQGRASHRAVPSPGEAQPAGDARHREEGKEGSRETLGPDGFPASENQSAQQSDSPAGLITNRPPSKTNTGGEDWLEVSLYIKHENFHKLSEQLDEARKAVESGQKQRNIIRFAGMNFVVRPSGASAGTGDKRVYFRWQLQCENGLIIQLMNRKHPHRTMPNGNVRATSVLLMQLGGKRVWRLALKLLRAMGCVVERNKLSRVDACVDMPGMPIASLSAPYAAGHHVTRARAKASYEGEDQIVETNSAVHSFGRHSTGFVVGQDALKVRAYDKFREANRVSEKIAAVVVYRWGKFTITASRVEFSIRREKLKAFGVDTIEDWFKKRSEICEYLCTNWFRLTNGPVDPNHADRAETLAEWILVQQAFADWTGKPANVDLKPIDKEKFFPYDLVQQAVGLFVSFFARTGNKIDSNESFADQAMQLLLDFIDLEDIPMEVWLRGLKLGIVPPSTEEMDCE